MTGPRHTTSVSLVPLTLAFFLAEVSDLLFARDQAIDVPDNARATSHGKAGNASKAIGRTGTSATPLKCLIKLTRPVTPMNAYGNANGVTGKSVRPAWLHRYSHCLSQTHRHQVGV